MAYNKDNLFKMTNAPYNGAFNLWGYRSTDNFAAVKAAQYISNAFDMGVKVGDVVIVVEAAAPPVVTIAVILTCTATACTMSQTGVVPST